ncbi:MAG TPA: hypothetical protein VFZ65_11580 [Planctomycetota bacterium]|nr:hypothetical protein [Planctomycetota bacterium]
MSWRRILLFSLVFLVAMGGATWALLQNSDAATHLLRREMQALLACPAQLESSTIDLAAGRLSVAGVRIDDPTRPGQPLLVIRHAAIDVGAGFSGSLISVHDVLLEDVDIDLGPRLPTAAELLRGAVPESRGAPTIPPIELRRGHVRFTPRAGVPAVELQEVHLLVTPLRDSPSCAEISGTAVLVDLGAPLELRGTADLRSGAARLAVTLRDLAFDRATRARVQQLFEVDFGALDAAAHVSELTAQCQVPARAAGTAASPVFAVAGELDGVRVGGPDLPDIVRSANVTFHVSNTNGGSVTARLRQDDGTGHLDVTARATDLATELQLEVRAEGKGIRIDDRVLDALRTFAVGREVTAALQPTAGLADLDLYLRNPQARGGLTELDLQLQDVAMAYFGFGDENDRASFPLPLVQARGRVRLRDDVVLLEDLQAAIAPEAGGGTVHLTGRVETDKPGGEDATLDIQARGVAFSSHLREALTALLRDDGQLYDKFTPDGRTAVDVMIRPQQQLPGGWSVEVRPDAKPTPATMQWAGFPLRLGELQGSVTVRADGAEFHLEGTHGGGRLELDGHIPTDSTPIDKGNGFEAVIGIEGLAFDDDLRRAVRTIAPEVDTAWRESTPSGRFDGQVKVWRPVPDDPLYHDVRLDLTGVDLKLPIAPWRAVDLRGQVIAQGANGTTRIDFDALRGRLEHGAGRPAQLAMLGSLQTGEALRTDLAFVVRELELDAQLGTTLEQLQALGSGTWDALRPSGKVDLVCRHERDPGRPDRLGLVVQLVDVGSDAAILPKPARHMTGELMVADGQLTFSDVRAEMGGKLVKYSAGSVHNRPAPDGRTEIRFTMDASSVVIDDGIANLFAGPLHQAVLDRHLTGRTDVDQLQLTFAVPGEGNPRPFETTLSGQLRLYDVEMSLGHGADGIRVQGISGVVNLLESTVSDDGGGLRGLLRRGSFRVFGQPFESVETDWTSDAERIVLNTLRSSFHGGTVNSAGVDRPALTYLLPSTTVPEGRLSAELAFEKVDVYAFLDTGGWTNPPYSGMASGRISLARLDGSDVVGAEGSGELEIEHGDLGVVPLFTAIYAQLPAPDRPHFNYLESRFRLVDRRVDFDTLNVRSNLLAANGKGTLDLDGYLDIEMKLDNLLGTSADPLLMPLIDLLTTSIVRFHLFGYLRDLHAEKRWVTERSPRRRQIIPMPPARPRQPLPAF